MYLLSVLIKLNVNEAIYVFVTPVLALNASFSPLECNIEIWVPVGMIEFLLEIGSQMI